MMYQIQEDSIRRLQESSKKLHSFMVSSPVWNMIKNDPIIKDWIFALDEIDSQVGKNEANP